MDWAYCRTDKERTVKRIKWRLTAVRRPRFRWEGHVTADLEKIKTHNWSKMVLDGEKWKTIVQQGKTHKQL
jgi:hypothetical protein